MTSEVFRFITVRPTQLGPAGNLSKHEFRVYARRGTSPLVASIASAKSREDARTIASDHLRASGKSIDLSGAPGKFISILDRSLRVVEPSDTRNLPELLKKLTTDAGLGDLSVSDNRTKLGTWASHVADGLLASVVAGDYESAELTNRIRLLRVVELVDRVLGGESFTAASVRRALRARPILPALRIPNTTVPTETDDSDESKVGSAAKRDTDGKFSPDELLAASVELRARSRQYAFEARKRAIADDQKRKTGWLSFFRTAKPEPAPRHPARWQEGISAKSIEILRRSGVPVDTIDLRQATLSIEAAYSAATTVHPPAGARMMASTFGGTILGYGYPRGYGTWKLPIPTEGGLGLNASPTVPSGTGEIGAKKRGDLYIVRQTLERYELGEIAHVENVMRGEANERTFSRTQTTEDSLVRTEEIISSEERDLQSSERFELSSESKETIKDDLKLEAGTSITASYGPTIGIEAGSQVAFEHAQEKSKESASQYAREVTNRAQSRIETRVTEQRSTRVTREVRELTRHAIDNSAGAGHVQGVYRWVNKVYKAQLVNYGIRDLYGFYVPEPAAFYRWVEAGKPVEGISMEAPESPTVMDGLNKRPLQGSDLTDGNYHEFVAIYGATDVAPPPTQSIVLSAIIEKGASQGEEATAPGSKAATEVNVPDGYQTSTLMVNGIGVFVGERDWHVLASGEQFDRADDGEVRDFEGRTGSIPMVLVYRGFEALAVGVRLLCERTQECLEKWQLETLAAIMAGYQRQKATYDEQLVAARESLTVSIQGRNPLANERIIRDELKRLVITMMTEQRFEDFDSMRGSAPPFGYPEVAFRDARAEGKYVAFIEQAFEWENLTYLFYPYFWGKKAEWPLISQLQATDFLFEQFLKAGFARIQLPVRPGFESLVDYTFDPSNWSGDQWVGDSPPGFESDGSLSIEDEMIFQSGGGNFVQGLGFVSATAGANEFVGTGTDFTSDDIDRELRVETSTFQIIEVVDSTHIRVAPPSPAASIANLPYALGPKLVGLPWEIVLPTTLIYLQSDAQLNP